MSHFLFLYLLCSINSKRTNAQIHMQLLQIWTALWPRIPVYKWLRATGTRGCDTDRQLCRSPIVSCALALGGETPTSLPLTHKYTNTQWNYEKYKLLAVSTVWFCDKKQNNLCLIRKKTLQCSPTLQGNKPFDFHESPNFQIQKLHSDVNSSSPRGSI